MSQPTSPAMIGGVRNILVDFSKKQSFHAELLFGVLLILGIVFPSAIPLDILNQLSTLPGRALLFGLLVTILIYSNWVYGLLFAVFIAVIMSMPLKSTKTEGFMSEYTFNLIDTEEKWFVEKVLNENPVAIKEDRVRTIAVQDDNESRSDTKSSTR